MVFGCFYVFYTGFFFYLLHALCSSIAGDRRLVRAAFLRDQRVFSIDGPSATCSSYSWFSRNVSSLFTLFYIVWRVSPSVFC